MATQADKDSWLRDKIRRIANAGRSSLLGELADRSLSLALTFIAGTGLLIASSLELESGDVLKWALRMLVASVLFNLTFSFLLDFARSLHHGWLRGSIWSDFKRIGQAVATLLMLFGVGLFSYVLLVSVEATDLVGSDVVNAEKPISATNER